LVGDLSLGTDGAPMLHAHVVVARRDGSTLGGHLLEGLVRPTLEIVVSETDAHLRRRYDERSGLPLIALDES
jgi:predicted DNA-binding protein with PD1-like motif